MAIRYFEDCIDILKKSSMTDLPISTNYGLALAYHDQKNYSLAFDHYKKSLKSAENRRPLWKKGDELEFAKIQNSLASLYEDQGNLSEAIKNYKESYDFLLKTHGKDHPMTQLVAKNLATAQQKNGFGPLDYLVKKATDNFTSLASSF